MPKRKRKVTKTRVNITVDTEVLNACTDIVNLSAYLEACLRAHIVSKNKGVHADNVYYVNQESIQYSLKHVLCDALSPFPDRYLDELTEDEMNLYTEWLCMFTEIPELDHVRDYDFKDLFTWMKNNLEYQYDALSILMDKCDYSFTLV